MKRQNNYNSDQTKSTGNLTHCVWYSNSDTWRLACLWAVRSFRQSGLPRDMNAAWSCHCWQHSSSLFIIVSLTFSSLNLCFLFSLLDVCGCFFIEVGSVEGKTGSAEPFVLFFRSLGCFHLTFGRKWDASNTNALLRCGNISKASSRSSSDFSTYFY